LVLLRVGFTELPQSLGALVSSYLAFSPLPCGIGTTAVPQDGMFSVALSLSRNPAFQGSETVRVTDHPALRSSDFPLLPIAHLCGISEGATICSPSTPPFLCNPPLNRQIRPIISCSPYAPRGGLTHLNGQLTLCLQGFYPFDRAKPAFEGGNKARLRVNLEQAPAFVPGSRKVHFAFRSPSQ